MPELRWILITFGFALLIGIYAWGRRSSRRANANDEHAPGRPDPVFEADETYEDESPFEDPQLAAELEEYSSASAAAEPAFAGMPCDVALADPDAPFEPPPAPRSPRESRRARIEPTFSEPALTDPSFEDTLETTAQLPADDAPRAVSPQPHAAPEPPRAPASDAPTLSMSNTPSPRRIERRKIIALRIAAGPERIDGAQLQAAFDAESLQHGKYDVFHRLEEEGASLFSIASMVEPGTFDPESMADETYPGITLFAQLPGPLAGMIAFNELVACARRLHSALGGTLQDDRGVPLTVHRIERIRQEIRDFEHRSVGESGQRV